MKPFLYARLRIRQNATRKERGILSNAVGEKCGYPHNKKEGKYVESGGRYEVKYKKTLAKIRKRLLFYKWGYPHTLKFRQTRKSPFELLFRRDIVAHFSIVKFFIAHHIEIARTR